MKVSARSKSFKKSIPLLLLIAAVQFLVIGMDSLPSVSCSALHCTFAQVCQRNVYSIPLLLIQGQTPLLHVNGKLAMLICSCNGSGDLTLDFDLQESLFRHC
jgi:hypothetical protein